MVLVCELAISRQLLLTRCGFGSTVCRRRRGLCGLVQPGVARRANVYGTWMMSIGLGMTQEQIDFWSGVYLVVGLLVSVVVICGIGVFSRGALHSPDRLAADRQPGNVVLILLAGLAVWILTPAVYAAYRYGVDSSRGEVQLTSAEQVVLSAVASTSALVVLLIGNIAYREGGLRQLGLQSRRLLAAFPQGVVGIMCIMPVIGCVNSVALRLWKALDLGHPAKHELLEILDKTPDVRVAWLLVFTAVVIVPVYEELLFRGHLQSLLRHYLGRSWAAILLTSGAFAVVHPWWSGPSIFVLSVCLGYAYERRGNLWLPMMIHSLFNAISILFSVLVGS